MKHPGCDVAYEKCESEKNFLVYKIKILKTDHWTSNVVKWNGLIIYELTELHLYFVELHWQNLVCDNFEIVIILKKCDEI